jgi:hypothetical protein
MDNVDGNHSAFVTNKMILKQYLAAYMCKQIFAILKGTSCSLLFYFGTSSFTKTDNKLIINQEKNDGRWMQL